MPSRCSKAKQIYKPAQLSANASIQGGYFILPALALGARLPGPMSGFNNAGLSMSEVLS